jgi:predicted DNA binding CopG/RHH family protein
MKNINLDQEEQDLLEAFDAGEFQSTMTPERKHFIEAAAAQMCKKDKRINIKISERDLTAIQKRAFEEGLSYQSLVASILHKYVSGTLYDASANKNH